MHTVYVYGGVFTFIRSTVTATATATTTVTETVTVTVIVQDVRSLGEIFIVRAEQVSAGVKSVLRSSQC